MVFIIGGFDRFEKRPRLPTLETRADSGYAEESERGKDAKEMPLTLRCLVDGLLLSATLQVEPLRLIAFDGDESFVLEAVEAIYYEIVTATREELLGLERACYRLLRPAFDFQYREARDAAPA